MTFRYKSVNPRRCYWLTAGCLKGLTHCAEGWSAYQCQGYVSTAQVRREQKEKSEKTLNQKVSRALKAHAVWGAIAPGKEGTYDNTEEG